MTTRLLFRLAPPPSEKMAFETAPTAKRASVLFDELLFERNVMVLPEPGDQSPPRFLRPDEVELTRSGTGRDAPMDADTGNLVPKRRDLRVAETVSGWSIRFKNDDDEFDVSRADIVHEAHPGVLVRPDLVLFALGCSWARGVIVDPDEHPSSGRDALNWLETSRAVASAYETAICGSRPLSGATALSILVPDLASLRWEAIARFRDHSASRDARHRLNDFEHAVRAGEADLSDVDWVHRSVAVEISRCLLAAWTETRTNLGTDLAKEAAKAAIGFVPLVGPALSSGASVVEALGRAHVRRTSWLSALTVLEEEAGR
jgi:hypothetical protein